MTRFTVSPDGRRIYDNDFHYDAMLTLSGDFPNDFESIAYANTVAAALNAAAIPTGREGGE